MDLDDDADLTARIREVAANRRQTLAELAALASANIAVLESAIELSRGLSENGGLLASQLPSELQDLQRAIRDLNRLALQALSWAGQDIGLLLRLAEEVAELRQENAHLHD